MLGRIFGLSNTINTIENVQRFQNGEEGRMVPVDI